MRLCYSSYCYLLHNKKATEGLLEAMLPKDSGHFIARLSKNVMLCPDKALDLAEKIFSKLLAGKITPSGFSEHPCHPEANEAAYNWIFLVDTLNFCFWSEEGVHWEVEWKGVTYTGYFALCAAVKRATEEGVNVADPKVYCNWKLQDLENLLRGDNGVLPMLMQERLDCLHEVGKTLIEKYQGNFLNCVKQSEHSAQKLLNLIVTEFPCYQDEASYCGETVSFYKRAQILVGDIWACFEGQEFGNFYDIDSITMFADYRVPQVLKYFGLLEYGKELSQKLKEGEILPNSSREEVEIRGCSIEAVEIIKARVNKLIKDSGKSLLCNSILIDHFLWTYRREHREKLDDVPFHKTICIYY